MIIKKPFCTTMGLSFNLMNTAVKIMCPVRKDRNPNLDIPILREIIHPANKKRQVAIHFNWY
jgi:hypothetical protein